MFFEMLSSFDDAPHRRLPVPQLRLPARPRRTHGGSGEMPIPPDGPNRPSTPPLERMHPQDEPPINVDAHQDEIPINVDAHGQRTLRLFIGMMGMMVVILCALPGSSILQTRRAPPPGPKMSLDRVDVHALPLILPRKRKKKRAVSKQSSVVMRGRYYHNNLAYTCQVIESH